MIEEIELKKEVEDLVGMLDFLRLIRTRVGTWNMREVRLTFNLFLRKMKE